MKKLLKVWNRKSLGIKWRISADNYAVTDLADLRKKRSGLLDSYPDEMRKFQNTYAATKNIDDKTAYLFFIEGETENKGRDYSGYMPRNKQFGYIFTGSFTGNDEMHLAVAHELGHGQFVLKHTFDKDYKLPQGKTDNLMDYTRGARHIAKWQWDLMHDPGIVMRVFERDKDAASRMIIIDNKHTALFNHVFENKLSEHALLPVIPTETGKFKPDGWDIEWTYKDKQDKQIDDIIKKIQNIKNGEFLPKIALQSNSVYTGKQKLDGTEYNVALYSRKASLTNLQKVVVKDVADLRSNFHALKKPLFCESSYKNYLVIACYEKDEEEPSLIIQATQSKGHDIFSETQLKAWMHYLGILVDVRDIRLENVRWISQFSSEINGRPCHWCGTSGTCCNGGTACTTCPKDSTNTKKCCMETCSTDTLTTCDSCTNQQICNTRACKSNSCCYYTALTMIEQFGVTTNLNQKEDIATLISNSNWKKQSDLKVNIQNFIWSVAYIDSILKLGKPVLIGVHYDNDYPHPYNDNKATFHYMVIVGKTYKYDKEYYMFYDPGREFINQAKATSETNLLEVDRNKNMIHGTYKENPYTITEVRKNL